MLKKMFQSRGLFLEKRLAYAKPKGPEKPGAAPEKKEISQEEIDKRLEKGVEYKNDISDPIFSAIKKLGEAVYKEDSEEKKLFIAEKTAAMNQFLDALNMAPEVLEKPYDGNARKYCEAVLKAEKCNRLKIEKIEGKEILAFYKGANEVIFKNTIGVQINVEAPKPAPKPEAAKEKAPKASDEQKTALDLFRKQFPKAKPEFFRAGPSSIGEGSVARIPQARDLPIYTEEGKKTISRDNLGEFRKSGAKITKSFSIVAPNDLGAPVEYLYIEAIIEGSIRKKEFTGWIERSRLLDVKIVKPEEKVAVAVSAEKIEEEKVKVAEAEKVKAARKPYLDEKGIVHLKAGTETREVKLQTLFPNAKVGDRVMVTSKASGTETIATYDGKDWVDSYKKHVPIFNGDKVILLSRIDYEAEKPKLPALEPEESLIEKEPRRLTAEQIADAKAGELHWNKIARSLMTEFPQIKETGIKTPDYAKLLAQYSTETGYYWVILPAKVKPAAEEEAAKEVTAGKKRAEEITKKGEKEREKLVDDTYEKYRDILMADKRIKPNKVLDELADDHAKWNEAWNKNHPINSRRIMEAFRRPPFNAISETKIRDTVWEALSSGPNGLSFGNLFEYFNKQGEFYRNLKGQPGSFGDFKDEWKMVNEEIPKKIEENKKNHKPVNYDFSKEENEAYQRMLWSNRPAQMEELAKSAAMIMDAIFTLRPVSEAPKFVAVKKPEAEAWSKRDETLVSFYRKQIYNNENMYTPDEIDPYINDEKKWNDMWEKDQGNILALKKALQRPPFNRVSLGAHKTRIREAMYDQFSKNDINMDDLLEYLNPEGEIYKNREGEPGRYSDFEKEFYEEQIGAKVKKGEKLSPQEQKIFDESPNKKDLGSRYGELSLLWLSSAHVFDAIRALDPKGAYAETVPESERPRAFVDEIFPPTDTGSINGVPQDYYDTYKEEGEGIAGGGLFTGGLFKYDFRDSAIGISDFDLVTSHATANRILLDQCGMNEGRINKKKLQARLNELIRFGLMKLLAEPESEEKKKALLAIGATGPDLVSDDPVNAIYEKLKIDLDKTKTISAAQKDMIRLGFLLETVAKPGEVAEVVEWSDDPKVRRLQAEALRLGAKPADLPKIEKEIRNQIIAFLHLKVGKNFSGVEEFGVTVPIRIAGKGKTALYLAVGGAYNFQTNRFVLRTGIGGSVEVAKGIALIGGIGVGGTHKGEFTIFAGAGVSFDIPVDKDTIWEPNITVGAMASTDFKGLDIIVGGALMFTRNLGKQYEQDLNANLERAGFKAIENAKDVKTKAQLLRQLPGPGGKAFAQMQSALLLDDEGLVNLYEQSFRKKIELETGKAGLSEHKFLGFLPPITAAGFGVGIKFKEGEPPSILPGVAFAVALGSELIVFQRPVSSTEILGAIGEEKMAKQAEDAALAKQKFIAEAKAAGYAKVTIEAPPLVGDMETGLKPLKREMATIESTPAEKLEDAELEKVFAEFRKELLRKGLQLEKVGRMYRLRVLNMGNLQLYADPQMKEKTGVFLKDGEIFISAGRNPKLVIKRMDLYYPRPKEGNLKHTIITVSDEDFRTQKAIMEESDYYMDTRTKDATGEERTALAIHYVGGERTVKQFNLRGWNAEQDKKGAYKYFDTLETTTEDMLKYREAVERSRKYGELGRKAIENIGTADLEQVDIAKIHALAEQFMKKHPILYRRYTTYQIITEPDLKKLNAQIKKDYPNLTDDEVTVMKEELFNLSMSEAEKGLKGLPDDKKQAAKEKMMKERLNWIKNVIYVPYFKKYLNKQNNPNNYTAEEVAEAFIGPLRTLALANPEAIPPGARVDVAVGTENIFGRRGVVVGNPEAIKDHRIFAAKDYTGALLSGQPPIDKTIALVLRESQRPLERLNDIQFLASPMAIKLMVLGTEKGRPILVDILGENNYKKLADCYGTKPPGIIEGAEDAVKMLRELAMKLSDAQEGKGGMPILINGKEYYSIVINGIRLGIRTDSLKSGVYERCLNASHLYNDEIVSLLDSEKYTMVGNFRSYDAAAAQSLTSSMGVRTFGIGLGVIFDVGPKPPRPPGGETPKGEAGGEGTTGGAMPSGPKPEEPVVTVPSEPPKGGGATPEGV